MVKTAEAGVREAFPDKTDDELRGELRELRAELEDVRNRHMGKTREDAHRRVDEHAERMRAAWDAALRDVRYRATRAGGDLGGFTLPHGAFPWTQPAVVKALHAAIDADHTPGEVEVVFSDLTPEQVRSKLDDLKAQIAAREGELDVRDANREAARVRARVSAARERREGAAA